MVRYTPDTERWEVAHVNSRRYRAWLESYDLNARGGVPPHIEFGGAVVSGAADPTFKDRWTVYALETFC